MRCFAILFFSFLLAYDLPGQTDKEKKSSEIKREMIALEAKLESLRGELAKLDEPIDVSAEELADNIGKYKGNFLKVRCSWDATPVGMRIGAGLRDKLGGSETFKIKGKSATVKSYLNIELPGDIVIPNASPGDPLVIIFKCSGKVDYNVARSIARESP